MGKAMSHMVSTISLYVKAVYNQNRVSGNKIPKSKFLIEYQVTHPSTRFTMDLIPNIGEVMEYRGRLVRVVKVVDISYFNELVSFKSLISNTFLMISLLGQSTLERW